MKDETVNKIDSVLAWVVGVPLVLLLVAAFPTAAIAVVAAVGLTVLARG